MQDNYALVVVVPAEVKDELIDTLMGWQRYPVSA